MSGPPPTYDEALTENASWFGPPMPLVVRLRVWHYWDEGRSPTINDAFAALFHDLQEWEVVPLELEGVTGPGAHDQYVPVEVQFRHRVWAINDPGEHPMADVRRLFYKISPPLIHRFFISISSTPYSKVIFPVGAPEEIARNYTHECNLNRLGIRINLLIVPGPVRTNDVQSWLQGCVNTSRDVSSILGGLIGLYLMSQRDRTGGVGPVSPVDLRLLAQVLDIRVPDTLPELQNLVREFTQREAEQLSPPRDIQTATNRLAQPLQSYLYLMSRMQRRWRALENNQRLSDQDVFELVGDSYHAQLHYSNVKHAIEPLVKLLERGYASRMEAYNRNRNRSGALGMVAGAAAGGGAASVLTTIAVLNFWNPVLWTAVIGGVIGYGTGVSIHANLHAERGEAFGQNARALEVRIALGALDDCFNQGREAMVLVHHRQLMNMELDSDSFPDHARQRILDSYGINVADLVHQDYREVLVGDRLHIFRVNHNHLEESVRRMFEDANLVLRTTEEAIEEAIEEAPEEAPEEATG